MKVIGLIGDMSWESSAEYYRIIQRAMMAEDFSRGRLEERHGLEVLIPDKTDRDMVHKVIYDELCQGKILEQSKREYLRVMKALADRGASGTILGCTEIQLLIKPEDSALPVFDTTRIHAEKAVELALS